MNRERFEELLDDLLERELTPDEAGELAQAVRTDPAWRGELRRHLVLWELWSQQQTPERSADAFVAACRTRLRAEREDERFVAGLNRRIREERDSGSAERSDAAGGRAGPPDAAGAAEAAGCGDSVPRSPTASTEAPITARPFRWRFFWDRIGALLVGVRRRRQATPLQDGDRGKSRFPWGRALQQPAAVWGTAVSVVMVAAVFWIASPGTAQATTTTVHGEAVCTACMLHETHDHLPAIRVRDGQETRIYYVQSPRDAFYRIGDYCRAPVPLIATGRAEMKDGRLLFDAESLQSTTVHDPRNRIMFPF